MAPHIRCHEPQPVRIPRTQSTKSGYWEAFRFGLPGYGPSHCLPHNCSKRSAHFVNAERLSMQSHQELPWDRRTDRQWIPRLSSIMTAAIVLKACSQLYGIPPPLVGHTSFRSFTTTRLTRAWTVPHGLSHGGGEDVIRPALHRRRVSRPAAHPRAANGHLSAL